MVDTYGATILTPVTDQNISPSQYGVPVRNAIIDLDRRIQETSAGLVQSVMKAVTDTVTNSVTLHLDSELILPVLGGTNYLLQAFIIYTAPDQSGAGGDFRLGWSFTVVPAMCFWTPGAMGVNGSNGADGSTDHRNYTNAVTPTVGGAGAQQLTAKCFGIIQAGATDGTVNFRFAEGTAGAATSAVALPGSWMSLTPMS